MILQFMKKGDFMQLILLLLLLMSGSSNLQEVKPLLKEVAGEDAAKMLDEVEGLTQLAAAFAPSKAAAPNPDCAVPSQDDAPQGPQGEPFPLAPISNIADEGITYCLSRYISTGQ